MAEKKYYWLKLHSDFFNQKEIKKLRRLAGGAIYTIVYLKMQLLSLKHGGAIVFENVEDTVEEELALELDETTEDVQMTLLFLKSHGLIEEISADEYLLPKAVECIGAESFSAERMRRFRERRASQCDTDVTTSDKNVTLEKEIEIEKEKRRVREELLCPENRTTQDTIAEIIAFLNLTLGSRYTSTGKKTCEHISARLREGYTVDDFKTVILKKHAEWKDDSRMSRFLRPETLFGTKFESYLNQPEAVGRRGVMAELYYETRKDETDDETQ